MKKFHTASLALLISLIGLSGCSATVNNALRAAGESYQCEREAANRPNEAQRLAECQTRLQRQREREQVNENT